MTKLSKIEQGYVDQGYTLPKGITWETVHDHRAKYDIEAYLVPVTNVAGLCSAWGVPIINGAFLEWRSNA